MKRFAKALLLLLLALSLCVSVLAASPEAAAPAETGTEPTETAGTEPEQTEAPDPTDPEEIDPEETEPEEIDPEEIDPEETEPEKTDPEETALTFAEPEDGEIISVEEDFSYAILQSGGLLVVEDMQRGAYDAAKQAIYAGLRDRVARIDLTAYSIPVDSFNGIYRDVINSHPELFYVVTSWTRHYSGSYMTAVTPQYDTSFSDADIAAFNAKCASIIAQIDSSWSNFQKYLFLHDYIVTHCEYDLTYSNYDAYDVLVTGSAVCQGYALAYGCLCNLAGLDCRYVSSAALNHAWNIITLGGENFYVDCTWDDPSNHWYEGYCGHSNFLRSRSGLVGTNHSSTDWVSGDSEIYNTYPGSTRYDSAWFIDVITPIPMSGSMGAYAKKTDDANHVFLRNISTGSETSVTLEKLARWYVWGDTSYYTYNYTCLALIKGNWYYSTPTEIWKLTASGAKEKIYTLTSTEQSQGYIYGIVADGNMLYYNLGTKACDTTFTRKGLEIKALEITKQPSNYSCVADGTASFSVTASGGKGTISYQWYVKRTANGDWEAISGATSATYSLTAKEGYNGYQYRCRVSAGSETVYSNSVTLTVTKLLVINSQPANVSCRPDETASFSVTASGGNGTITYQWYVRKTSDSDWEAVSGATSATYSLTAKERHDGYQYRCKVSDGKTTLYSSTATLAVAEPLAITKQPSSLACETDETASFSVTAVGGRGTRSYQWYVRKTAAGDWEAVSGATSASYSLTAKERHNGYQYRCRVSAGTETLYSGVATLTVTAPLSITKQPASLECVSGETAVFSVAASGGRGDISYRWYVRKTAAGEWESISDATEATYSLTAKERHDGYAYRCKVSDGKTTLYSYTVTLTVRAPLSITKQPVSLDCVTDETATFSVAASGGKGTIGYKWYVLKSADGDWESISGATEATYSLTAKERHNGYAYRCRVTAGQETLYSNAATLTVTAPLSITKQPASVACVSGETAAFSVTASGGKGEISYRWYVRKTADGEWESISDATAATYSLTAKERHNGYVYRCRVSDGKTTLYSGTATLAVAAPLSITKQPASLACVSGETAAFSVAASGGRGTIGYKWYVLKSADGEWESISDATEASYSLTAKERHNGYQYRCRVTAGQETQFSNAVTLTVLEPLSITKQPVDAVCVTDETAVFTVAASGGKGAIGYKWYVRKTADGDWESISDAAAASYSLTAKERHNGYQYRCRVTAGNETLYSETVTLTVLAPLAITKQPVSFACVSGETASFTVAASGGKGAIGYKWYVRKTADGEWESISDATEASYSLTAKDRHNGYAYRCRVTAGNETLYSNAVTLTVLEPLSITKQPASLACVSGETAAFTVAANGGKGTIAYQWYVRKAADSGWETVSGATEATYSLTAKERHNGYAYRCRVSAGNETLYSETVTLTVLAPLAITKQPASLECVSGETAVFSVTASGGKGDVSFQWYVRKTADGDWEKVSDAAAASYSLTAKERHNGYAYRCKVSAGSETQYSNVVTLTVLAPLAITEQPVNCACVSGETAAFTVAASGGKGTIGYQWYVRKTADGEWEPISGATEASYSLTAKERHNGYAYRCRVSAGQETQYSNVATLTVLAPLSITKQPENNACVSGETALFTVAASGGKGEISFQWYVRKTADGDWEKISDAAEASYSLTAKDRHDGYAYRCKVSAGSETQYSNVVTLTVLAPLAITKQPESLVCVSGETAVFTVAASGGKGAIGCQWYVRKTADGDWESVSGATEATYSLTAKERHDGYVYRCRVSAGNETLYSETVTLTVLAPLSITEQPADIACVSGETAAFTVAASGGKGTIAYQWYVKKTAEGDWEKITDAASATYSLTAKERHDGYAYRCRVSAGAETQYSSAATLTVLAPLAVTKQPESVECVSGETAVFVVAASGGKGKISFQWYVRKTADGSWEAISGAAYESYSLTAKERHDGYQYRCKVSAGAEILYSDTVTLSVLVPLTITAQPESLVCVSGETAVFTVAASGGKGEISCKWYVLKTADGDWEAISGAVEASYSLTAKERHDGYAYRCKVSAGAETQYSSAATLTVLEPLSITKQPADLVCLTDETAVFTIAASGGKGEISYKWYVRKTADGDWESISGAAYESYSLTAKERHDGYAYRCRVNAGAETLYSETATLTVLAPLAITAQPESVICVSGETAAFSVTASGGKGTIGYQWYVRKTANGDWEAISGATASSYSLTAKERHDGYAYRCKVSAGAETQYSNSVTLTVLSPLAITKQPASLVCVSGETALFTVTASSEVGDVSWQWYVRKTADGAWEKISGATSSSYSLTAKERHNGYAYYCKVSDGTTTLSSETAALTVLAPLTITAQPGNVTCEIDTTALFTVAATSEVGAISYQWYVKKTADGDWEKISGATAATYSLTAKMRHNGYAYSCKVTDGKDTLDSGVATLTILAPLAISAQPEDLACAIDTTALFTVTATSEVGTISYQWYVKKTADGGWEKISGATEATYSLTAKARHNGYAYSCKVTDGKDTLDSAVATLTILAPLAIEIQPDDLACAIDETASFSVTATSEVGAIRYQWYVKKTADGGWEKISGATEATYSLTAKVRHNGYTYYCVVTDGKDTKNSGVATLTILAPLAIEEQPEDLACAIDETASFSVTATSEVGAIRYQWYVKKTADGDWEKISGATAATYSLTAKARHNGYAYSCKVTDGKDTLDSAVATLTII